jgi:hypothetical protein
MTTFGNGNTLFLPGYGLELSCAACGTTYTRYPVVVLHPNQPWLTRHLYGSAADFCLACETPLP